MVAHSANRMYMKMFSLLFVFCCRQLRSCAKTLLLLLLAVMCVFCESIGYTVHFCFAFLPTSVWLLLLFFIFNFAFFFFLFVLLVLVALANSHCVYSLPQMSSDGNQTTSTLSITLGRADSGRYLSCRAYNHVLQSESLEDGWRLDIQCKFCVHVFQFNRVIYSPPCSYSTCVFSILCLCALWP